ncbi:hypothetical protein [Butyrivibrio sp. AE3004]|uniref:hypothetical protein n=1 Tax=Butyrivibrio sp. AE3004 TaxID=1506994 RepID=UPI000494A81E|nr:hypothetical protein [Butyrivibrio sp. AE3004]
MSIGYFLVLKKAGLKKWTAVVPFLAERELSTVLFKRMRTFYRSFAIAAMGKLEAGDTLQFVFDRYTQDGELISSTTEVRPVVVTASGSPKVEFKAIEDGDYIIGGVLTDVYQRKMTSKIVNVQ